MPVIVSVLFSQACDHLECSAMTRRLVRSASSLCAVSGLRPA
jgi:hypothetical protein